MDESDGIQNLTQGTRTDDETDANQDGYNDEADATCEQRAPIQETTLDDEADAKLDGNDPPGTVAASTEDPSQLTDPQTKQFIGYEDHKIPFGGLKEQLRVTSMLKFLCREEYCCILLNPSFFDTFTVDRGCECLVAASELQSLINKYNEECKAAGNFEEKELTPFCVGKHEIKVQMYEKKINGHSVLLVQKY